MSIGSAGARRWARAGTQAIAGLALLAGATFMGSAPAPAATPPPLAYRVVHLGRPDPGWSNVGGINEHGQVSGTDVSIVFTGEHSFFVFDAWTWDPTTGQKGYLQPWSGASGINERGDVAVELSNEVPTAARWEATTGQVVPLPGLASTAIVSDIGDDGTVVGSSEAGGVDHAVRWVEEEVEDLGALAAGNTDANAINASGQVVGASGGHAFRWDPATKAMVDLGVFGGTEASATDLDDAGRVVGWAKLANGNLRSFLTAPNGADATYLGTLGGGTTVARAVNNRGVVVGTSDVGPGADTSQAFVRYADGAMAELPHGGGRSSAVAVNDRGWIAGTIGDEAVVWVPGFADVPDGAPFHDEIGWALEQGIVNGFGDGTFRPAAPVSRQAVAAMLYRLAGSPAGPNPNCEATFADVPVGSPFCGEITWLATAGLTAGDAGTGAFHPRDPASRGTVATWLYRLAGNPDGDVPPCPPPYPFSDVSALESCGMVAWMATEGIAAGYADGGFHPDAAVSRQAMAAFLYRFSHR